MPQTTFHTTYSNNQYLFLRAENGSESGLRGAVSYRFGFQGQEVDNEIKGEGNSVNYKYRVHDPRLGRFFSIDPLTAKYPFYSPYAFSGNRVIDMVELEGLEPTESAAMHGFLYGSAPVEAPSYEDPMRRNHLWSVDISGRNPNWKDDGFCLPTIEIRPENTKHNYSSLPWLTPLTRYATNNSSSSSSGSNINPQNIISGAGTLTGACLNGGAVFTNSANNMGFWIGTNKDGSFVFNRPSFYGNQSMKKSQRLLTSLSESMDFAGLTITAIFVIVDGTNLIYAYSSGDQQSVDAAYKRGATDLGIGVVSFYYPGVGTLLLLMDMASSTSQAEETYKKNLEEKMNDYSSRGNYAAWKKYQRLYGHSSNEQQILKRKD